MYIFKFDDTSQYSIAGANSGISGLSRLVEPQYVGKHRESLVIKAIAKKGDIFTIIKVIDKTTFESSYTRFLISFDNLPFTKRGIITTEILNLDNPPDKPHWSDPPIFDPKAALPLPSDGVWWK
ncbi:MAG: hypothetical protein WCO92_04700 [Verrucomicrobiota bacterium]